MDLRESARAFYPILERFACILWLRRLMVSMYAGSGRPLSNPTSRPVLGRNRNHLGTSRIWDTGKSVRGTTEFSTE